MGKGLFAHAVEARAHIVGSAVGREDGDALQSRHLIQAVDVVQAHIVVEFVGLGLDVEILVNHTAFQQSANAFFIEAIRENAVFIHEVSHENQSARFGHALGFKERFQLLFVADEMVERAEQKGEVRRGSRDEREVSGIALNHIGGWFALQKHVDVASHKLNGLHAIALCHECRRVAPRARTDVEQEILWSQKAAQMVHGGFKFHNAVPALQTKVLGVFVIVFFYIG